MLKRLKNLSKKKMIVYKNIHDFKPIKNAVVTSGTFDGVHKGHQKILNRLNEVADGINGESVVITYHPHPRMVIATDSDDLKLLSTIDEKIQLLENQGVKHLIIIPFTREFSELTSSEFINKILVERIGTKKLVIGYDHRFGRNREGGFDYLKENSNQFGFEIEEIPRQEIDHLTISSTKIRNSLIEGNIKIANELLGRMYSFTGLIAKGRQLGRTIGFPTANVQVSEQYKLIPSDGVYAVKVHIRGEEKFGMMNIGMRPTVNGIGRTQEVNIFDFEDDIYGEKMNVELIDFVRKEKKFNGLDELKAQINQDKTTIKTLL
jgi:riboflavin kinase / FMN adenylyltransferase